MSRRYTPEDEATLVEHLNHLLHSLALPISLISPTDLTPRLLIAILESLLGARLPLIAREGSDARTTRVQNMKIFLGVLETDILCEDVGLSDIDPRRLADGEYDEVSYVAQVLCSIKLDPDLARAKSIPLPRTPSPPPRRALSPKSQLDLDAEAVFQTGSATATQLHQSLFSPFLANNDNSTTNSFFSSHHEDEYGRASDDGAYSDSSDTGVSDILGDLPPRPATPPRPRNNADSLLFSSLTENPPIPREQAFSAYHQDSDFDDGPTHPRSPVRIRYDGYIAPVDEEAELASFEHSRSHSSIRSSDLPRRKLSPTTKPPPTTGRSRSGSVKAQYTRTLELLTERARLITQLSELKQTTYGLNNGHG